MSDIRSQIEQIVSSAAQQIALLVQQAAADGVAASLAALSNDSPGKRSAKSANGRSTTPTKVSRAAARGKGAKRPPAELAKLAEKVAAFIAKNPGLRIEQINKELGTTTKDLALPLRKLIAEKTISTKGEKRATTYYAKNRK